MSVVPFALGNMDNFVHLIYDHATKQAAVIDPAWHVSKIIEFVHKHDLTITHVLLTHSHFDHINGLQVLLSAYPQAELHLSAKEAAFWGNCPAQAHLHQDGETIWLGKTAIQVIETPGHTPGSVCYYTHGHLITGDTLFIYGCGRCDLVGGDAEQLFHSLQKLIKQVPSETCVHPGHDYGIEKISTFAAQIAGNPFLHCADSATFVHYRMVEHDQIRHSPYAPVLSVQPSCS
jgi:hydroxyacylglutathione hydrolase